MLVADQVALPLPLVQYVAKHEEAAQHQQEDSEDAVDHHIYHEDDDGRESDTAEQEGQWVHESNVARVVHLETKVKSLEAWMSCFVEFSFEGDVQLSFLA